MQIAWIIYGSLGQKTGGYIYDRIVVEGLRARGHRVDVIEIDPRLPHDALVAEVAGAEDLDVIVGDELCFDHVSRLFLRMKRELVPRALRVLLVHHLSRWELEATPSFRVLVGEARALRHADIVVATSHATASRLAREGRADVIVVRPGADRIHPRSDERDSTAITLLSLGAILPRKRVLEILDAIELVASPRVRLRIVGEPRDVEYAGRVRARIAQSSSLKERARMSGVQAELDLELAASDAIVSCASFEGYGMALAEASFCGLPAIASDTGAAREIVGDAGILFPPHDLDAMKSAVVRFVSDAALRADLRTRAQKNAARLPRWIDAINEFEALLARWRAPRSRSGASPLPRRTP